MTFPSLDHLGPLLPSPLSILPEGPRRLQTAWLQLPQRQGTTTTTIITITITILQNLRL
jgi:hypothetical protein